MKLQRLSRLSLLMIFLLAISVGMTLRLYLMPPTIPLTGAEARMIGTWDVQPIRPSEDVAGEHWQFDRDRNLIVSERQPADGSDVELFRAHWEMREDKLRLTKPDRENANFKDQSFAITFGTGAREFRMTDDDGVDYQALRTK